MIPTYRVVGMLALTALGACVQEARHPIDQYLSQLRPVTVAPLAGVDWPAGTLVCPLSAYQNSLPASEPVAERVNAFLKSRQFAGDEFHWSIVAVKPRSGGGGEIEHLIFKKGMYQVVTEPGRVERASGKVPAGFVPLLCVPIEEARVLATRDRWTNSILIGFGKNTVN